MGAGGYWSDCSCVKLREHADQLTEIAIFIFCGYDACVEGVEGALVE